MDNLENKSKRLHEAVSYLKINKIIRSQKELAEKIGTSAPNLSSALGGSSIFLNDKFLLRFNNAVDNIFNYDWLTTGKGNMLKDSAATSTHSHSPDKNVHNSIENDIVKHIMDVNNSLIEQNKSLIEQNHYIIERVRVRNDQLFDLLNSLKKETEVRFNNLNTDRENKLRDIIAQCSTVSIDEIIERINKN